MKIKSILASMIVAGVAIATVAVEAGAQTFTGSANYNPCSGSGYFSNTGDVSTAATDITYKRVKIQFMINGVCSRYVTAYIEKLKANGAMEAFSDISGTYYPSSSNSTTMTRNNESTGKSYHTVMQIYRNTNTLAGIADSYFYTATIV